MTSILQARVIEYRDERRWTDKQLVEALSNGLFSVTSGEDFCLCLDPMRQMIDVRGHKHTLCNLPITDESYAWYGIKTEETK